MNGFRCPFCGQIMSVSSDTVSIYSMNFRFSDVLHTLPSHDIPYLQINIFRCPNDSCQKETIIAVGQNGYIDNNTVSIYPQSHRQSFPSYIPPAIRKDYEEACTIVNLSPKASATLARRCLQGMIRDFWGIQKARLVDEIDELQGKIPASQWSAIDSMRRLGNIGAHMEKDVNLIIDIDQEEAENLLRLIELLMKNWYINRHDEQELYASIQTSDQQKKTARAIPKADQTPPASRPQGSNTV